MNTNVIAMPTYESTINPTEQSAYGASQQPRQYQELAQECLMDAALNYAKRGWPVFPLHTPSSQGCSCRAGASCQKSGKHPRTRNGLRDASTDLMTIAGWWNKWPDANIGIVTGAVSGLLVIDVDDHGAICGSESLQEIEESIGEPFASRSVITGQGKHIYFNHPGGTIPSSVSKLGKGIDVRGDDAYIIAPPSLHSNGIRYRWEDPSLALCNLPEPIVDAMRSAIRQDHALGFDTTEQVYEGMRNKRLFEYGCALRGREALGKDDIVAQLREFNERCCVPPLDDVEVMAIAENVCKYPAAQQDEEALDLEEGQLLPWFKLDTLEWLSDANINRMSDCQAGHYIWLRVYAWNAKGCLPNDVDQLWRLAHAKSKSSFVKGMHLVLAEYRETVVRGEPMLVNPRMAASYEDKYRKVKNNQAAGRLGAAVRWGNNHEAA